MCKKLYFLFAILFLFVNCQKEVIILPAPQAKIVSIQNNSLTNYNVIIDFDLGEGQEIINAELIFKDITLLSDSAIIKPIELTDNRLQSDTINVETKRPNHDFSVKAKLVTYKYTYFSNEYILRSIKNTFNVFIYCSDELYKNIDQNIASFNNQGDHFGIIIDYLEDFNEKSIEIKLNNDISLECNLDFENYWSNGDYLETMGFAYLPENILPGDYEVCVYIDGIEFKAEKKIRILEGNWMTFNETFPGQIYGYSYFKIGDNLYVIDGLYDGIGSSVWKLNLPNKTWSKMKNIEQLNTSYTIFPFNIEYNGEGYILVYQGSIVELWKYNTSEDNWFKITEYPGTGIELLNCFIIDSCMYISGGSMNNTKKFDSWKYNFETQIWNKLGDTPAKNWYYSNISCVNNGKAYVFDFLGTLWEYTPGSDTWINISTFKGPWRIISNLVTFNDNIYLIGGSYTNYGDYALRDCWEYSINTGKWNMKAFLPDYSSHGISFVYNNKITTGLGYAVNGYYSVETKTLFEFIP